MKTILTKWELRTYDVWGNAKEGYEVNDSYNGGEVEIRCRINTHNVGTPNEFQSAYPTEYQLGQIFGTRASLSIDGDDTTIYVSRASDDYPLGELKCISHESLSPIK